MEGLDLRDGDENDHGLLSTLDIDLPGSRDLKLSQLGFELGNVLLEVEEGLSDLLLDLRGRGLGRVGGTENL